MKINVEHLESVRNLLGTTSAALTQQTKEAAEAEAERLRLDAEVRGLQGAFDVVAARYAADIELSPAHADTLPTSVQQVLGISPKAKPAA